MRATAGLCAALAAVGLALTGCGRAATPLSPESNRVPAAGDSGSTRVGAERAASSQEGGFYPLEPGNHWRYTQHNVFTITFPNGDPPITLGDQTYQKIHDLDCVEQHEGRDYVVRHTLVPQSNTSYWDRLRQDRTGLYQADVFGALAPTCAPVPGRQVLDADGPASTMREQVVSALAAKVADPGRQAGYLADWDRLQARVSAIQSALGEGLPPPRALAPPHEPPASDNILILAYPLHPGARWTVYTDGSFRLSAVVEGQDVLDLPVGRFPAWRIRLTSSTAGPNDRSYVWYGRAGRLKYSLHAEGPPRPAVTVTDYDEELVELSLIQ